MKDKHKKFNIEFDTDCIIRNSYTEKSENENEEVKEERWFVEGNVATDDLDLHDDIITEEALIGAAENLIENSTVLYNHDDNVTIGKIESSEVKDGGLWVKILISKTVPEIWEQIKEGVLNKFSIRGRILDAVKQMDEEVGKVVRVINSMYLVECSLVSVPANPRARAMAWYVEKALNKFEEGGGEIPMDKKIKKNEDVPAVEETPKAPETPAVEETPKADVTPVVEETPKAPETPAVEETPKAPETPAVEETPKAEEEKKFTQKDVDKAVDDALKKERKATSKLEDRVNDLEKKLEDKEADVAIEKKWNEKYAGMYAEEDADEIKGILKKSTLGVALTPEEADTMIEKKMTSELPSGTPSITKKSDEMDEEKRAKLIKMGGLKIKAKK